MCGELSAERDARAVEIRGEVSEDRWRSTEGRRLPASVGKSQLATMLPLAVQGEMALIAGVRTIRVSFIPKGEESVP
jgi:hypothetical protein